ncbi:uncharacterized protein LOC124162020 [Ischnura elegans]|uniref:uncharacterized protein LOC124162020 n=1 Tax=Ischnura elegans TaxID=197161 RepID=UPI001ED8AEFE|nr:uncharacterized protein LOC124162020 [Ischnura elegans]
MSAQSGFLNCFLKFIQGEKCEKLPEMRRGKPATTNFTISFKERNDILSASSKRLNEEKKAANVNPEKKARQRSRPRSSSARGASRSTRSKGSVSEVDSEPGVSEESGPLSKIEERLCSNDGDESSGDSKLEGTNVGDGEVPSEESDCQSNDSVGRSGKTLRSGDRSKKNVECSKEQGSLSNDASEAESATIENAESTTNEKADLVISESAVILNEGAGEVQEKEPESLECLPSTGKKKRGKKRKSDSDEDDTPRRQLSSRKAKQKPMISYAESGDEEILGLDDNSDSDDPVWVPDEKKGSSDEGSNFSWSKYEKLHLKAKKSGSQSRLRYKGDERGMKQCVSENVVNVKVSGSTKFSSDGNKGEGADAVNTAPGKPVSRTNGVEPDSKNVVAASSNTLVKTSSDAKTDISNPAPLTMPFQSGKFIALKTDLEEKEDPTIWRVDGKSLLQKYEPFRAESGNTCYRNVSTYSGWGPKSHFQYQEIPVKFIKLDRVETIVEIIKAELPINEDKLCEKIMIEYEKYSYAYEVFVQTLLSQALDSNFLSEIIAEKDDYFLNCVEEMDKVCEEKKTRLMAARQWPKNLTESLVTWPTLTLTQDEPPLRNQCSVCSERRDVSLMKMDGKPYKFSTLEHEAPSEESSKSEEFLVCSPCSEVLVLFHNIVHLKYHTYENGIKLVSEKNALDPDKHNTDILHDILADVERVKKEFQEICRMWAKAEIKSRKVKSVEEKKFIS